MDSVDFIAFVCRQLNHSDPADGFDTFEVGSIKIEPTQWHKPSTFPPHADASNAVIRQILERPVLIKKDHAAEPKSCKVIKNIGANVSNCDINPIVSKPVEDRFLGRSKLEVTKRKLRQQYEKKKRRIQIVEFQKSVDQVQTKAKKPPVKKQIKKKRNVLKSIERVGD